MLAQLGLAAAVGIVVALVVGGAMVAASNRSKQKLGERVSDEIEPYLRRRAAELGLDPARPVWTARHSAAERVEFSAAMAKKLLADARGEDPGHSSTALAQTSPAVDSGAVTAPRPGPTAIE